MREKFQNKYRIPSARLKGYDYSSNGCYFITICTKNRQCYFGSIVEACDSGLPYHDPTAPKYPMETHNRSFQLQPTIIGQIANEYWREIPKHYPFIEVDEFVVMPNHIHGILIFNREDKFDWIPNQFGTQSRNVGAVIRAFKSSTKRYANQKNVNFEWQSRYHDRIIRNEKELKAIRQYIFNNPSKWQNDGLNISCVEPQNWASSYQIIEYETEHLFK